MCWEVLMSKADGAGWSKTEIINFYSKGIFLKSRLKGVFPLSHIYSKNPRCVLYLSY